MIHKSAKIGSGTKFWYEQFSNIGNCRIGSDCIIHSHVWIGDGVVIGSRVRIEAFTFIPPGVTIEDDVFIGPRVTFTNDKYPPSPSKDDWEEILVKKGASLGAGSILLPGITIGEHSLIGAAAVVSRSVEPGSLVMGNPAKKYYSYECELCHIKFSTQDKRGARFCSRRCYLIAWNDPIKKVELGLVAKDYKIIAKYKEYQNNCIRASRDFDLSFDEFKSFWQVPCFYCDDKLDGIGLDRINNKIGYTIKNIVSCCWECNRLKGDLDSEIFFEQIKKIYKNTKK